MTQNLWDLEDVAIKCPKQILYYIKLICRRAKKSWYVQKISIANFMSSFGFQASKIWMFFGKIFAELVWKSFSGRNSSLEPPVFWFSNSLPYGLEESRELWILITWFWVSRTKRQKISTNNFCFALLSCYYGFTNYFEVLIFAFSNTIPRGVSICKILLF